MYQINFNALQYIEERRKCHATTVLPAQLFACSHVRSWDGL